jgi:hypothetical protein
MNSAWQVVRDPAKTALTIGSVSTILPRTISQVPVSVYLTCAEHRNPLEIPIKCFILPERVHSSCS